ncbi:MAG: hypothetical protein HKN76_16625 [Saprospiraceae bacterium]|nr:hypothetical protein [Saprospiraceae bacterium]
MVLVFTCCGCGDSKQDSLDSIAEEYVKLVLEIGQYDGDFVDAYYGPEEWKPAAGDPLDSIPPGELTNRVVQLIDNLDNLDREGLSDLEGARLRMLGKQCTAVLTKLKMLRGETYSFDQEAMLLYDTKAPSNDTMHFNKLLAILNDMLPGKESLPEKYREFSAQFIIPPDKLDQVFQTAIMEARERCKKNLYLPANENFRLEYVTDKSWSGYNYYQGNSQSLIQINTDLPIYIERAIDLACHEGYPGHHVFNALIEKNLVQDKNWLEFSIYPLFSPQSLIAEGSANYGIEMAFPGKQKVAFEKEVLYPLAGIDTSLANLYDSIQQIRAALNYAGNEAARAYLDGNISREEAASMLEKYLLYEPERALQRTHFIDQYRSYVINYNWGKDLVADYVENAIKHTKSDRWIIFEDLLSTPHTASSLSN